MSEPLARTVLERRERLPLKPDPVSLDGRYVRLLPLVAERDAEALFRVSDGSPITLGSRSHPAYDAEALIWRYLPDGPFDDLLDFRCYLEGLVNREDVLALCVVDVPSEHPIGVTTFMSNVPAFLRIELGNIWYSPIAQRTSANLEATTLMLTHAFGLGYRRVEWKCDAENDRSRRSALRMGFQFEGIQEQHMIIKGRNRDTAWFRMLDHEWPEVESRLHRLLGD